MGEGRERELNMMYLCTRHGLRVHDVMFDSVPRAVESCLQQIPDSGLTRARGTYHHHTHPLTQLCVQLQCLVDLTM